MKRRPYLVGVIRTVPASLPTFGSVTKYTGTEMSAKAKLEASKQEVAKIVLMVFNIK